MANITPYIRAQYPTIEGNDRQYFENEFRKIQQALNATIEALTPDTEASTIATGAISVMASSHPLKLLTVDTEGAAASDDLDTITGGKNGQLVLIRATDSARSVVAKDATGNLALAGDMTLDNAEDTLTLMSVSGTSWVEVARSNNGA